MITIVIPVRNEEAGIEALIESVMKMPPFEKEVVVVDGDSKDNTPAILERLSAQHSPLKVLHNSMRYVPYALNQAIAASSGDPVVRLDAHTRYAHDYFEAVLACFSETGADIVGGPMRADSPRPFGKAVAYATSTIFGVGDSGFHDETKKGFSESVYLGAWRRSVFSDCGKFDTDMLRNQDDEFHYRARSKGKRIFLDPAIRSWYSPRTSFTSLFKQYFQYGLFKPLVLRKVKSGMRLRHLVPSAFVLYILLLPLLVQFAGQITVLPLLCYALIDLYFTLRFRGSTSVRPLIFLTYPTLHIAYGSGFLLALAGLRSKFMPAPN